MKFGLSEEIYQEVKRIVKKYPYRFKIFGSRARGNYKRYSDIDIAILKEVEESDEYSIRNDFDLLEIPYTIDLIFVNKNTKEELLNSINEEGIDLK